MCLLTCGHIQHMYSWWWVGFLPETCRVKAFAKNKPQLLHLVGIIFTLNILLHLVSAFCASLYEYCLYRIQNIGQTIRLMLNKETTAVYCENQWNKKCTIFSFNPDLKPQVSKWLISNTKRSTGPSSEIWWLLLSTSQYTAIKTMKGK